MLKTAGVIGLVVIALLMASNFSLGGATRFLIPNDMAERLFY